MRTKKTGTITIYHKVGQCVFTLFYSHIVINMCIKKTDTITIYHKLGQYVFTLFIQTQ